MHTYNTNIPPIKLRRYGRNIEKLVLYLVNLKEREKRQCYAEGVIRIMRHINQRNDRVAEPAQLWADLMAISDYKLAVEPPYPVAKKVKLRPVGRFAVKPRTRFRCCGRLVSDLIERTCGQLAKVEDPKPYLCSLVKIVRDTHDNRSLKGILKHIEEVARKELPLPHAEIIAWFPEKPRSTHSNRPRRKRYSPK